jgi:hypothetical protein
LETPPVQIKRLKLASFQWCSGDTPGLVELLIILPEWRQIGLRVGFRGIVFMVEVVRSPG